MPRNSHSGYTRWESVDTNTSTTDNIPFHEFEEEKPQRQPQKVLIKQRLTNQIWFNVIRSLVVLIIFLVGLIFGFLLRWGVHQYYIDPRGHCVTPLPYRYSKDIADWALDRVNPVNIGDDFEAFCSAEHHRVGSRASEDFAGQVYSEWEKYGFKNVEIEAVNVRLPVKSDGIPSRIVVRKTTEEEEDGENPVLWRKSLEEENLGLFSPSAAVKGKLKYAHLGRVADLTELGDFNDTVAVIRISSVGLDPAIAVKNAAVFGAKAAVLFPDPFAFKLQSEDDSTVIRISAKTTPGDPDSPWAAPTPTIPAVSVSFKEARTLLDKYTEMNSVPSRFKYKLNLKHDRSPVDSYAVEVEVNMNKVETELRNVFATIPGRFEPTRYVLIGSHHDTLSNGSSSSKAALAHSVLMELTGVFADLYGHGWKPGRSLIFASWDGDEMGSLGATAWLRKHSRELTSRVVAAVDIGYFAHGTGSHPGPVAGSPVFREIIRLAAQTAVMEEKQAAFSEGFLSDFEPFNSPFQTLLGVSSVRINIDHDDDLKPRKNDEEKTDGSLSSVVRQMLNPKFDYAAYLARFAVDLALHLCMEPTISLSTKSYVDKIKDDFDRMNAKFGSVLSKRNSTLSEVNLALLKMYKVAENFHSNYAPSPLLEYLNHHEYSDQIMELERAFIADFQPRELTSSTADFPTALLSPKSFKHIVYGPNILETASAASNATFLPHLTAALELASNFPESNEVWEHVKRESFFAAAAFESAGCVLENHLVYQEF